MRQVLCFGMREGYVAGQKKIIMAPVYIAMLAGMVLLFVFQVNSDVKRDPLYTDLTASPYYAKNGYSPDYAGLDGPRGDGAPDWDYVRPPHGGSLPMSLLPVPADSAVYGKYSLADRAAEEFTVLIPFTLDNEKYGRIVNTEGESHAHPALYFVGLGENWEIFLNGRAVSRQLYPDGAGGITRFRSVYGLAVPLDKSALREGDNTIVIRIIGARAGKWTGLRYVSPYYLGDIFSISNGFERHARLVLCAVFMFAGLYHLLIYALRKTDQYNLLYTAATTTASVYYFVKTPMAYAMLTDTAYLQRLDYTLLYLFAFLACAFVDSVKLGKVAKPTMAYGAAAAVLTAASWVFPIWFAYEMQNIWQFFTILFAVFYVVPGMVLRLFRGAAEMNRGAEGKPGLWRALGRYLTETEFGNFSILLFILVPTALADILSVSLLRANLSLSQYGYLGVILWMIYVMARKFPSHAEITERDAEMERLKVENDEYQARIGEMRSAQSAVPDELFGDFISRVKTLTPAEMNVFQCYFQGVDANEIPEAIHVSANTVKFHNRRIYAKLGVSSREELMLYLNLVKRSGLEEQLALSIALTLGEGDRIPLPHDLEGGGTDV
ncbi:MAG: helix-turn-helix transcriptional regulator [Clostridiales bacterium]|nr:helix-turn-helix transcriptional regulator [Clostridiales bacterium]